MDQSEPPPGKQATRRADDHFSGESHRSTLQDASEQPAIGPSNDQNVDLEHSRDGLNDHQREGPPRAAPSSQYLNKVELSLLFIAQGLTASLVLMYVMIIATAIPSITKAFQTVEDLDWYSTAYLFSLCAVQPLMAKAFDLFPLKAVYLASIAVFEVGNVVCGVSQTSATFIVGRAIAGIGAAGIQNGSLVMLTAAAAPDVRGALMGMGMGLTVVGGAFGPVVGGVITQHLGWRWCMWIFLPPGGAAALVFFFLRVPEQRVKEPPLTALRTMHHKLDIPGFAIFVPAVVMLLLAVSWGGQRYPWRSATILGLFLGGVFVLGLFVAWTWHRKDRALVPPSILKKQVVFCGCVVVFLQIGAFATVGDYLPLWFQSVKQATPTNSGLMLLPAMVTQILATIFCGFLLNKLGYIPPWALAGNVLSAIGSGLMTTFTPSSSQGKWVGYQVLVGVGRGWVIQMPAIALQYILSGEEIAIGTATIMFFQYFGSAVFLAISKSIFLNVLDSALHKYAPSVSFEEIVHAGATELPSLVPPDEYQGVLTAYSDALVSTFWLAAAASVIAFFFSFGLGWTRVTEQIANLYTKDELNAEPSTVPIGETKADKRPAPVATEKQPPMAA